MTTSDLMNWFGDAEVYEVCVTEDVEDGLKEAGIPESEWDEYKESIRKAFSNSSSCNDFIRDVIEYIKTENIFGEELKRIKKEGIKGGDDND